jgi:hypothetical protein
MRFERDESAVAPMQPDPQPVFDMLEQGAKAQEALRAQERQAAACEELEAALAPHIKRELAAQMAAGGNAADRRQVLERLAAFAATLDMQLDLPHHGAPPALIAGFLIEELDRGDAKHVARVARGISYSHRALNLPDPTVDFLVTAVLASIKTSDKKQGN